LTPPHRKQKVCIERMRNYYNFEIKEDKENKNQVEIVHSGVSCDSCSTGGEDAQDIVGPYFRCMECDDFDLCKNCFSANKDLQKGEHKKEHKMIEVLEQLPIHDGIKCDSCSTTPVIGVRYKCKVEQCQTCAGQDSFDLCEKCMLKLEGEKNLHHFEPITVPEIFEDEEETTETAEKIKNKEDEDSKEEDPDEDDEFVVEDEDSAQPAPNLKRKKEPQNDNNPKLAKID